MFNGSSNIIINGGTFIVAGHMDNASLSTKKEICENISQDSAIGSNTGQGPTTDQSSSAQEANAQEPCKPQVDPTPLSHSADNFETSVHASGQVPEYGSYLMPTPSITSEVKSCQTVGVSRRNAKRIAKPNVDLHAALPFPTPSHFSNPQYDANVPLIPYRKRHPTDPQPDHSQFGASPTSSRYHVRASTYPFPTPSPHFPIPQLDSGAHYI